MCTFEPLKGSNEVLEQHVFLHLMGQPGCFKSVIDTSEDLMNFN